MISVFLVFKKHYCVIFILIIYHVIIVKNAFFNFQLNTVCCAKIS